MANSIDSSNWSIDISRRRLPLVRHSRFNHCLAIGSLLMIGLSDVGIGACQDTAVDDRQEAAAEATADKAAPIFVDGQAQVVPAFRDSSEWIRHDLFVETEFDSDGDGKLDRMHVSVVRQAQTETEGLKVPVIYETSPYFCGVSSGSADFMWDPKHELGATPPKRTSPPEIEAKINRPTISRGHIRTWVPRGFAVVHSCSPGTGLSQGCPTVGGINEALAPKAVIDWLNGRARGFTTIDGDELVTAYWCTGKVGMTGTSYNGTLPIAAATTGVEGLEAIIPDAPNTSYYHYYRANGLVRHPGGYMGEDIDVLYDFIHSGNVDFRGYCNRVVREEEHLKFMDRETGDLNEFWAGRDYHNQLDNFRAAALMAHGFNDWNVMPSHTVRIYLALKERGVTVQNYFHQGGHGGPPPMEMMNKWFTRFLYGVENGVEKDPQSWVVRENDDRESPTPYTAYPHPDAAPVALHPQSGGNQLGALGLNTPKSAKETLIDDVNLSGATLAAAAESPNRLLYATPPLKSPVHISGIPRLTIRASSSKPAVNLSVWLVALPYTNSNNINDDIITRGWADLQNHQSLRESQPLEPGKFYEMTFELEPDDQIIPAGQQIGLMIFSSDRDFTLWPEPGTELTVDLEGVKLELPIVGGQAALDFDE
ncbi:MAG: Xaa-Pro dipeptidyl-peptidase [Planctomycetaceae bacterium]|nr:Xaa-Pro dipeptidyl-peptidase [Planctomycetaceae bacterium]